MTLTSVRFVDKLATGGIYTSEVIYTYIIYLCVIRIFILYRKICLAVGFACVPLSVQFTIYLIVHIYTPVHIIVLCTSSAYESILSRFMALYK